MARRRTVIALLLLVGIAAYVAAPFHAAWQIREAVHHGDTARLARRVDWPSVRASLRSSLAETRSVIVELANAGGQPRPSLWQRMKAAAVPFVADPLIERYVTPEGAPRLYAWRQTWRHRSGQARAAARSAAELVVAKAHAEEAPSGWLERLGLARLASAYRRVDRIAFVSPLRLEIVVADRAVPLRRWHTVMELKGLSWQLTGIRIQSVRPKAS